MKHLIVLSVYLVAISDALVIEPKSQAYYKLADESLDNYIRQILEQLKIAMPNGIPELGIPVLDPFQVPHFNIPHIE